MVSSTCKQECAPTLFWEFFTSFYTLPHQHMWPNRVVRGSPGSCGMHLSSVSLIFLTRAFMYFLLFPYPKTYSQEGTNPHSQKRAI